MADRPRDATDSLDQDDDRLVLGDLVNRVLDKGAVIAGEVLISVADVDLVRLDLRLLLVAVESEARRAGTTPPNRTARADAPVLPRRSGE